MKKILLLTLVLITVVTEAWAKIGDPSPITEGNVTYQSHQNYVEAIDATSKKQIWRTTLSGSIEPDSYVPGLENDVQWHIACCLKITPAFVEAGFRGVTYHLDKVNGKIVEKLPPNEK